MVKKEELKEHSKKYNDLLKLKEDDRKKRAKFKVDSEQNSLVNREDFNTNISDHKMEKSEEEKKRKRRRQFQDKVKSMALLKRDHHELDNSEEKEQ